jgi:serine/threonine protein kinase
MVQLTDTQFFTPLEFQGCDEPPSADVPGYDLLHEIGRGGMGVVYRAVDLAMGREVAVKVLSGRYAADSSTAGRFIAEAQITGRLQHPGVPAVYHIGRLPDGRPFYALKLVKGDTLDALLESSEPLDRLAVFQAVAQTVGYAHARGVIHRDLKPGNVMVSAFGEIQVMDWGLAKIVPTTAATPTLDDTTATPPFTETHSSGSGSDPENGSVFGTPAFMAPEQAGGGAVDRRSDVFGLGAILCSLLTGRPPFNGASLESVHGAALHGETGIAFHRLEVCGSDAEVISLCKRCLSRRPIDRPPDAGAVAMEVGRLRAAAMDRARDAERARLRAEQVAEQWRGRRIAQCIVAVLIFGFGSATLGLVWSEDGRAAAVQAREAAELHERTAAAELAALRSRVAAMEKAISANTIRLRDGSGE